MKEIEIITDDGWLTSTTNKRVDTTIDNKQTELDFEL